MDFPQYRKYKNIETYFKIISEKEFEEISSLGNKYVKHSIVAKQYPEMLRIKDMLNCEGGTWEIIEAAVYLKKEPHIQ
ncbi:hypothetical protein OAN33_01350 [Flavobacteriales bacterium]|nr:hypothetical protein [Flavobacteriales bacterium]